MISPRLRIFILTFAFLFLLSPTLALATIQLPKSMTRDDRLEALRIVGFGTSSKALTDPYPLGGYSGFEAGIAIESLPAEDLGRLGARLSSPQQEVAYPKFSIGKGLYNNLDMFLHFTPYNRQDELSHYGGMLRWGFYQASFLPLSAALNLHVNSSNISNQLATRAYGIDLMTGVNVDNVSLYAGVGYIESTGTFIGGPTGITQSAVVEDETVTNVHTVVGANVRFSSIFLAIQLDRYTQSVFSGKLGVRF